MKHDYEFQVLEPSLLPRVFPSLFQKHTGERLRAAQPHVLSVYFYDWAVSHDDDKIALAPVIGRLGHLTNHSVTAFTNARVLAFFAVSCTWFCLTPLALKLRCLVVAVVYSFIELSFTRLERGRAYTSVAQFVANVLYTPLLLDGYATLLRWATLAALPVSVVYVLAFPLNVWVLEVDGIHLKNQIQN